MASINEDVDISGNVSLRGHLTSLGHLQSSAGLFVGDQQTLPTFPGLVAFATDPTVVGRDAPVGTLGIQSAAPPQLWQKVVGGSTSWTLVVGTSAVVSGSTLTLTGDITPASIGPGTVNNYTPAGLATASRVRQAVNVAGVTVTGLAAQPNGRILEITNLGTGLVTLAHENAGSTAANRFVLAGDENALLPPDASIVLIYDGTSSRWREWARATNRYTSLRQASGIFDDIAGGAGTATVRCRAGNPNGITTGAVGDLIVDITTPALWQNTTGAAVWTQVGGGSAGAGGNSLDFGDGSDGVLSIAAGTTTMTRDMSWTNVTITSPAILDTGGFVISISGTLAGNGTIQRRGSNGANAVGTTAGFGGAAQAATYLSACLAGGNGAAGSVATAGGGGLVGIRGYTAGGGGAAGAQATVGNSGNPGGTVATLGGGGGSGGGTLINGSGSGANVGGNVASLVAANSGDWRRFEFATTGRIPPTTALGFSGTGGGGGGRGGEGIGAVGGQGAGGGGGGSGGHIVVRARLLTFTGAITVQGGNGGNGGNATAASLSGGGGGGGGGSGGVIVIATTSTSLTATLSVAGGTGGAAGSPDGTGQPGAVGGAGGAGLTATFLGL